MAKDDPRERIRKEQQDIASAEGLFQGEPAAQPKAHDKAGAEVGLRLGRDLRARRWRELDVELAPPAPILPPPRGPSAGQTRPSRPGKTGQSSDQTMLEPSALVEEVWSRTAEWGPTFAGRGGVGDLHHPLCLLRPRQRAYLDRLADLARRRNGGGRPFLPDLDHARTTGSDHPRAGPAGLLWLALASSAPLPPDVVAFEYGRTDLDGYGSFEGFKAYWKDRLANLRQGHAELDDAAGIRGRRFQGGQKRGQGADRLRNTL